MLTNAARHFEAITGGEVDIEEGALTQAFRRLVSEDREILLSLVPRMKAVKLPGTQQLQELQESIEGILGMPTDDCVRTLAGEGKSYQESRTHAKRLNDTLTDQNINLLRTARHVLDIKQPILEARRPSDATTETTKQLQDTLNSEMFYEQLDVIRRTIEFLSKHYRDLYGQFHEQRLNTYAAAIDDVKGLPEWAEVSKKPDISESQRETLLASLSNKLCPTLQLPDDVEACENCRATIDQMDSEIAAVDALRTGVIRELQELATPEKKIVRVRVSSVLGSVVETPEDVEQAVERLKEHLLKLLAEDTRIVLE